MKAYAVILTVIVASVAAAPSWWQRLMGARDENSKPDFCKSYDCPSYKVIEEFDVSFKTFI